MICQACGVEAPTRRVGFYQNIGAVAVRFSKSVEGNLCKSCVHKYFWQFTTVSLFLGWWGVLSLVATPVFILNNLVRYVVCLGMDPVPPGALRPQLTQELIARLRLHTESLIERLKHGEALERVARDVALRAAVTPGQVALYVHALVAASQDAER
jgi:hypothetical protein